MVDNAKTLRRLSMMNQYIDQFLFRFNGLGVTKSSDVDMSEDSLEGVLTFFIISFSLSKLR